MTTSDNNVRYRVWVDIDCDPADPSYPHEIIAPDRTDCVPTRSGNWDTYDTTWTLAQARCLFPDARVYRDHLPAWYWSSLPAMPPR